MFLLGIIADEDAKKGRFLPSFILCRSRSPSPYYPSALKVRAADTIRDSDIRVLFPTIYGYEHYVKFMSFYRRTTNEISSVNEKGTITWVKVSPTGLLAWCKCNKYGEPTGEIIPIKWVPESKSDKKRDNAWRYIAEHQLHLYTTKELFVNDPDTELME